MSQLYPLRSTVHTHRVEVCKSAHPSGLAPVQQRPLQPLPPSGCWSLSSASPHPQHRLHVHAIFSRQNVTSNHRANDTVVCEGRPQVLNGRFMYGPLDVVTLTGEKVRTQWPWPQVDPPPSADLTRKWVLPVLPPLSSFHPPLSSWPARLRAQPHPPLRTGLPLPSSMQSHGVPEVSTPWTLWPSPPDRWMSTS